MSKKLYDKILGALFKDVEPDIEKIESLGYVNFNSIASSSISMGGADVNRVRLCEDTVHTPNQTDFTADVLIIGGGGGGGNQQGGGGGGGGYREFTKKYYTGTSYTVSVGAGGSVNSNGSNSSIEKIAHGGGAGGDANGATQEACNGKDGGSGGGSGLTNNRDFRKTSGGNSISPRCNGSSQGYPGWAGPTELCGSGGAGGTGFPNGGPGKTSTITGTSVGRAGGGAPGFGNYSATDGGGLAFQNGTANTGGGGGGNANGGSGFVCIKFPDTITITIGGGLTYTSSTSGGYTTVQFTAGTDTIEFFWNPKTYSGLELWLDSNDSETITLNGGTVSQWDDKSGNDYHVSQGTASNQPALTSNVLNGRDVLRFDGGDWLENLVATPVGGSTNRTIFIVANYTGSSIDYLFYLGTASNSPSFGSVFGISQETAVRVSNGNRIWATSVGSDHMILTISLDGTNITDVSAWQNGTALTISSTLGTQAINTSSRFYVGGPTATVGNLLEGDIAEVIVYSSALSTSDRESVESYLSNKWGIT
jgi:hypothetical protein